MSVTPVPTGLGLFFDNVGTAEAQAGSVAYRCFYIQNDNSTDTLVNAKIYIGSRTPSPSTDCELGLGTSGLNGTEQEIVSEEVAPVGVVFAATGEGSELVMASLAPGDFYPVWVKRTVQANAVGNPTDNITMVVTGD